MASSDGPKAVRLRRDPAGGGTRPWRRRTSFPAGSAARCGRRQGPHPVCVLYGQNFYNKWLQVRKLEVGW